MFHFGEKLDMRQYPSLVWVGGFYAITQVAKNYSPFQDGQTGYQDVGVTVKKGEHLLPSFLVFYLYETSLNHIRIGMSISNSTEYYKITDKRTLRGNKITDKRTLRYKRIMEIKKMLDKDLAKWTGKEDKVGENSISQSFTLKYNYHDDIDEFSVASQAFYRRIEQFPVAFQREFAIFKARLHGYA